MKAIYNFDLFSANNIQTVYMYLTMFGTISLALTLLTIIGMWRTFTKAGRHGWATIVPIYNLYTMLDISGQPRWCLLMFALPAIRTQIPLVNLMFLILPVIFYFLMMVGFAHKFGRGIIFAIGLFLLGFIFFPILGFSRLRYIGCKPPSQGLFAPRPANNDYYDMLRFESVRNKEQA